MRTDRASGLAVAALAAALAVAGCGLADRLTRPAGDGGWSVERRERELGERAAAAGVALAPPTAPIPSSEPLSLAGALGLAARGNRRIAEARDQLDAAAERFREARSKLLPDLAGSGRWTRYSDPLVNRIDVAPGVFPPGASPPSVVVRDEEAAVLNGTLAMAVDLSGELRHALAAAQAGFRGERARLWATTLGEQLEVVRTYYSLLEAERLRGVAERTVATEKAQLASAESRFGQGRLTRNELLVVQVKLAGSEQGLVARDLAIRRARWQLNQAVGLPVDAPTRVVEVTGRPELPPLAEALAVAYRENPLLVSLVEEAGRLEESERSLVASRLPRFTAGGAVDYTTSDLLEPQRAESGFAGFSWTLGLDGRREAEIAEARIAIRRQKTALERQLREVEAAVRFADGSARERLAALAAAEAAVGQAEENLRIRRQQFDVGRATSDDVLDAEELAAEQHATLASALYQAHARTAELRSLMGRAPGVE